MHFLEAFVFFIVGTCIGSFSSVLIYRLPRGENVVFKRSFCPECKYIIPIKNLIPLVSWLITKAQCSNCKSRIPSNYIMNELVLGFVFAFLHYKYYFTKEFLLLSSLAVILYSISVIDLKHYIIPDSLQIALLCHAMIFLPHTIGSKLLNSLIYFSLGWGAAYITKLFTKKTSLGWGDLKFLFITGFYLSYQFLPLFFFITGISGIILGIIWKKATKQELIPFAPSLSIGLYSCILYYHIYLL